MSTAAHAAGLNRLVFAEAEQAPALARLFLDQHARAADDVRASLEALHNEGALPRLQNSRFATLIFIEMAASLPRLGALLGTPLSEAEIDALTETAVEIFLNGCGRQ